MKKHMILTIILLLAACAPATNPPGVYLPISQATTDNAYIAPSYPTSQASDVSANQVSSGIDVRIDSAWRDGKNVNANVCFTLPDNSDWSVWSASLTYGVTTTNDYGATLVSLNPGVERCDTITFVVPPDADLSAAIITVDSIGTTPREDEYCTVYMPKIQQTLLDRGIGITLDCVESNGAMTMQIINVPPDLTLEQAQEIVFSDEFYTVKGPWVFTFSLQ
jgi:hypothetical protein